MRLKIAIAMLLAGGMLAVVQAQQGRGGFGAMGGVAQLVTNKTVQEDLKMSDEQVSKVTDWAKGFREKSMEIMKDKGVEFGGAGGAGGKGGRGKGGAGGGGQSTEMQEKMAEATAEINKVAYKELGDVLKKEQIDRLKQIDRQNMGVRAFSTTEVAEGLKLTDSQKASIKGLLGDQTKDEREIRTELGFGGGGGGKGGKGGGGGGRGGADPEKMEEMNKKIAKVHKEYMVKAVDLLNDDQKKTWTSMIGTAFDTSKLTTPMRKKD